MDGPDVLKPREERRKVLVRARMRCGARWSDVCIVNIASRGIGLQAAEPPERGEYLEIRRGRHVIVGRVVWSKGHRFGVKAQATLPVYSIANEPDCDVPASPDEERRQVARVAPKHETSRRRGRLLEFAFVAAAGLSFAVSAVAVVQEAFASPLSIVSTALAKQ